MKNKILILGANFHQQFLIKAAKNLNLKVFVADQNHRAYSVFMADKFFPISSNNLNSLMKLIRKEQINYVTTGGTFDSILTAAILKEKLGLSSILPLSSCLTTALDKAKTRAMLEKAKLSVPKGFSTDSLMEAKKLIKLLKLPIIVKPTYGSGSKGNSTIFSLKELVRAFKLAQSNNQDIRNKTVVVEEFIKGRTLSVETITMDGKTKVVAIGEVIELPGPYSPVIGTITPALLSNKAELAINKLHNQTLKVLGFQNGVTHVNYMLDSRDEPYLIDMNPRLSGGEMIWDSIIKSYGIDMNELVIKQALGIQPKVKPMFNGKISGWRRLAAPRKGIFKSLKWSDKKKLFYNIGGVYLYIKKDTQVTNIVKATKDTVGSITAYGATKEEVERNLNEFEKSLVWEII